MRFYHRHRGAVLLMLILLIPVLTFTALPLPVYATAQDFLDEAEERKEEPVESNDRPSWPQGPAIGAEAAVLMDADTGAVLYAKNMDEELFPASITKLMTCLVAIENCPLNEVITVSQSAINANEADGSHMYLRAGEQLTLEELLYGILINSANEACNAVGEHIGGSIDGYVDMMNAKAQELGCTHTHFVTANGLHNEEHYTSAHDMALIAQAFFSYDILCRMSSTARYQIPSTDLHDEHNLHSKNRLYAGAEYAYEPLVGSKTGFTSLSRQTLVSCAQKGDLRLICVILREESPYQFTDTVTLFDYGFEHFQKVRTSQYETRFGISNSDFFDGDNDVFGSTSPLMTLEDDALILLPDTLSFTSLNTNVCYDALPEHAVARIAYDYEGIPMGDAYVFLNTSSAPEIHFTPGSEMAAAAEDGSSGQKVYINIYHVLIALAVIAGIVLIFLIASGLLRNTIAHKKRLAKIRRQRGSYTSSRRRRRSSSRRRPKQILRRHQNNRIDPAPLYRTKNGQSPTARKKTGKNSSRPRRTIHFNNEGQN